MADTFHGGQVNSNHALLEAARSGDLDLVERLFNAGANKDFKDTEGVTPLHSAAEAGHLRVVIFLVDRGANRKAMDSYGRLPGHAACSAGASEESSSILKILFDDVEANQGVRKAFRTGNNPSSLTTALHTFVSKRRADDVEWILANNAETAALDHSGRTAWKLASGDDVWSVIGAFVLHGHELNGLESLLLSWYLSEVSVPNTIYSEYTLAFNSKVALYALLRALITKKGIPRDRVQRTLDIFQEHPAHQKILRPLDPLCLFEVSEEFDGIATPSKLQSKSMNKILLTEVTSGNEESQNPSNEESKPSASAGSHSGLERSMKPTPKSQLPWTRPNTIEVVPDFLSIVIPYFGTKRLLDIEHERGRDGFAPHFEESWEICRSTPWSYFRFFQPWPLDEYFKSVVFERGLAKRSERLDDQVLVRYHRYHPYRRDLPLQAVMVAQGWIWKIDDILITAPSSFTNDGSQPSRLLSHDVRGFDVSTSVAILLSELIDQLGSPIRDFEYGPRCGFSQESILDGFEKMIAFVFESVNNYVRDDGIETIDVEAEKGYLHRIHDVRDELSMMKRVLRQQEDVWRTFVRSAWPRFWTGGQDGMMSVSTQILDHADATARGLWKRIIRPQTQFREYEQRIASLQEDTDRIERTVQTKLDLKTKHATLKQTQAALKETHAVAQMSAAIFGFTVITIIFTPLAFVTALFALPIDRFVRAQVPSPNGNGMFTTNYIGKWFATAEIASVFVAVVAMWAALEVSLGGPVSKLLDKRKAKGAPKTGGRILELTSRVVARVYSLSVQRQRRPDLEATGH